MWWCGGVPCTKNYSLPSGNEEYYTTAPQCEMLHSRMLCWFAYFAASHVRWRKNASTLTVSVCYSTSVTEASKWDFLLQLSFSHVFTMASVSRCFHALGPIGSSSGPLFLAEYAQIFFSIFATYFTFCPVSRK